MFLRVFFGIMGVIHSSKFLIGFENRSASSSTGHDFFTGGEVLLDSTASEKCRSSGRMQLMCVKGEFSVSDKYSSIGISSLRKGLIAVSNSFKKALLAALRQNSPSIPARKNDYTSGYNYYMYMYMHITFPLIPSKCNV